MHYMTKGGYSVFVKPDYSHLYGTLELLLGGASDDIRLTTTVKI